MSSLSQINVKGTLYDIDAVTVNGHTVDKDVPSNAVFTDTTYESKTAASGGTDVSLCTTGEKYTWNSKTSNTGTVTKVSTGAGLTGGDITTSGTIKCDLKSETKSTLTAASMGSTESRQYAVGLDANGDLSVNVPWSNTTYSAGTGLSLSSTTFNHSNSITAGTAGTSSATSGSTPAIPYVTYDAQGHITAKGTHTHTVSGFLPSSGGTVTGNVNRKNSAVTIGTTSNNGVSSGTNYAGFSCVDSAGTWYGQCIASANSSGEVTAYIEARNVKTDGTAVSNIFRVGVKKDGTRFYYCSDVSKFRSDYGIQAALSTSTSNTGTNGFALRKYGNVVQLRGNNVKCNALGTVPSGWRPVDATTYIPAILGNGSKWYFGWLGVETGGKIVARYMSGTSATVTTSADWFVYADGAWIV